MRAASRTISPVRAVGPSPFKIATHSRISRAFPTARPRSKISGERMEMQFQLQDVIAGYEDFCDFDRRELHLIEALRTLRLIHYAAWIARRWQDPAFPAAFPWFGTAHYWQSRILELKEQIAAMDEPPLIV